MKQLEQLRKLGKPKFRRTTDLIVPKVTYSGMEGSLNNDDWAYVVPYAFRDALDIKYEQRKKDKKPYMVWTQGPLIAFQDGDLIHSKCGKKSVQVRFAQPMGWDSDKGEMYEGSVVYSEYTGKTKIAEKTVTQLEFFELLVSGAISTNKEPLPMGETADLFV